jgi:hypothetical protein
VATNAHSVQFLLGIPFPAKKKIGTATTTNQPSFPLLRPDTQDYAKKYVENISPMLYHYPI